MEKNTTKSESCECCGQMDESHEMTKCQKCGANMCASCLYIPTINSPCFCAACRSRMSAIKRWSTTVCLVRKGEGDYLERFEEQYPIPGRWATLVCDRASTTDCNPCIPVEAGKMLADLHDWCCRASQAMKNRKALSFDQLSKELDDILCLFGYTK